MSASWKKTARTIGVNNLIDRVAMVEDQNVNLQIALAATSTYFGRMPVELTKQLDEVLKEAQKSGKTTQKSLLDKVVETTKAFVATETDLSKERVKDEGAGALTRNQVLSGAAGEVVSVTREVTNE